MLVRVLVGINSKGISCRHLRKFACKHARMYTNALGGCDTPFPLSLSIARNIEVSAASAIFGWATCIFLLWRQRSARDTYYARYLLTFTFTQLVYIALWWLHEHRIDGGLQACVPFQTQFGWAPTDGASAEQLPNFILTKYVLPVVVFSQHATQCMYPSDRMNGPGERTKLILLHLIPVMGMSFAFACTYLVPRLVSVKPRTLGPEGHYSGNPRRVKIILPRSS